MTLRELKAVLFSQEYVSVWYAPDEHGITNTNEEMLYRGQASKVPEDVLDRCDSMSVVDLMPYASQSGIAGIGIAITCR